MLQQNYPIPHKALYYSYDPHPKLAVNWQSIFYGIFSSFLLLATTNPLSVLAENPVISRTYSVYLSYCRHVL